MLSNRNKPHRTLFVIERLNIQRNIITANPTFFQKLLSPTTEAPDSPFLQSPAPLTPLTPPTPLTRPGNSFQVAYLQLCNEQKTKDKSNFDNFLEDAWKKNFRIALPDIFASIYHKAIIIMIRKNHAAPYSEKSKNTAINNLLERLNGDAAITASSNLRLGLKQFIQEAKSDQPPSLRMLLPLFKDTLIELLSTLKLDKTVQKRIIKDINEHRIANNFYDNYNKFMALLKTFDYLEYKDTILKNLKALSPAQTDEDNEKRVSLADLHNYPAGVFFTVLNISIRTKLLQPYDENNEKIMKTRENHLFLEKQLQTLTLSLAEQHNYNQQPTVYLSRLTR
jgi:hypothetical protein